MSAIPKKATTNSNKRPSRKKEKIIHESSDSDGLECQHTMINEEMQAHQKMKKWDMVNKELKRLGKDTELGKDDEKKEIEQQLTWSDDKFVENFEDDNLVSAIHGSHVIGSFGKMIKRLDFCCKTDEVKVKEQVEAPDVTCVKVPTTNSRHVIIGYESGKVEIRLTYELETVLAEF